MKNKKINGLIVFDDNIHIFSFDVSKHVALCNYILSSSFCLAKKTKIFNIYAVQPDTQSVLMSEFIHQVC